jgi:mono/diheme cytochrome c family protein
MKILARLALVVMLVSAGRGIAKASGEAVFAKHCTVCHQRNGTGVPGMYPPLAGTIGAYLSKPNGRAYLVHVVNFGLTGPISSHGQIYNGLMQPWPQLTDADMADVLNYVLTKFNRALLPKKFAPYTAREIAALRAKPVALAQIRAERDAIAAH